LPGLNKRLGRIPLKEMVKILNLLPTRTSAQQEEQKSDDRSTSVSQQKEFTDSQSQLKILRMNLEYKKKINAKMTFSELSNFFNQFVFKGPQDSFSIKLRKVLEILLLVLTGKLKPSLSFSLEKQLKTIKETRNLSATLKHYTMKKIKPGVKLFCNQLKKSKNIQLNHFRLGQWQRKFQNLLFQSFTYFGFKTHQASCFKMFKLVICEMLCMSEIYEMYEAKMKDNWDSIFELIEADDEEMTDGDIAENLSFKNGKKFL
jgi:hypothetical protein